MAELDLKEISAHGLRAGYLAAVARRGVALQAIQQSQHGLFNRRRAYYNEAARTARFYDVSG
jgi:hypothetical protein